MRFKAGVVMWRIDWRLEDVMAVIDRVTLEVCGRDAIVTSARDGQHSSKSLHYAGRAVDVRTRDLALELRQRYQAALREALGSDFDVVLEPTHIHVEYDPR